MTNLFEALSPEGPTLRAMGMLYGFLAVATWVVTRSPWARPGSQVYWQVVSWWRLFPVMSLAWWAYPVGPWLLVLLISALSIRELAALQSKPSRSLAWWVAAGLALQIAWVLMAGAGHGLLAGLVFESCLGLVLWLGFRHRPLLLPALCLVSCAGLAPLLLLQQLPLAQPQQAAWFFYLLALTALNDVAQFLSGKAFGRHPIAKSISPNKTWQGLLGGVAATALLSWSLGPYLGLLQGGFGLLALGLAISVFGFLGDLLFSVAKRQLGIKDFSDLIPGHGGILDRVDSLVLTAPVVYLAAQLLTP